MSFKTIAIILAATIQVQAIQFEGRITGAKAGIFKITETNQKKPFQLTYKDETVQVAVSKLKQKDFISFEGEKNTTTQEIRIDSINYVGLSDLLGSWTGDDNYCYRFTTFTEVMIFPKSAQCSKKMTAPREFAYTVNIDDNGWFMLLSDSSARYAAELKFVSTRRADLSLYDVNSGNILRLIHLTK